MTEEQSVDAILAEFGGATAGAAIQLAAALAAARWEISNSAEHQRSELKAMQEKLELLSLDARRLAWMEQNPGNLLVHRFDDWTYGFLSRRSDKAPWPEPGREPWLPNIRAAIDIAMTDITP